MAVHTRLSRDQQKARTRERLIGAARSVFARRGFHGALLEEIADEAGYSTGAVYSNFDGKEELFFAVLDEHIAARLSAVERAVAEAPTQAAGVRAGADNWMQFLREDPGWYPLFIEFWSYAVRDPELRVKVARRFAAFPSANAELIAKGARQLGTPLPEGSEQAIGILVTALADGLALMKLNDPDAVPDGLFGHALVEIFSQANDTGDKPAKRRNR